MRWYQTAWGTALLILGVGVFLGVAFFGAVVIKYWWQIKHGQGNLLRQQVYGGFSSAQGGTTPTQGRVSDQSVGEADRNILEVGDFPFLGNPNASTTIVVFGEFLCPYTKEEWPILQRLINQYGYKIKLVFRNFPAESIHPGATKLSQIGICAYAQGKYWNAHNYLFAKQGSLSAYLSPADIAVLANDTGLDLDRFNTCLGSSATAIKVNKDYADGFRFGVGGTPTFFINGEKVEGVVPFETWEKFVKEL